MIKFVGFGIIVDDIVFPDGATQMGVLGGGGAQTAWGMAAALGTGEPVGLVAGVGADLDTALLDPLRAAGINLDGVRVTSYPTPRAWQVLEFDGQLTQVWRVPLPTLGHQLARAWDTLPASYRSAQWFHWGIHPGEEGSLGFARDLRRAGHRVSLEPFKPPDRELSDAELRAIVTACDVFSPNRVEATRLAGTDDETAVVARFRDLGCALLALRRGADGADVWDLRAGRGARVPAIDTAVVDTVGAGNAFCGALVARLADGIEQAACHASAAASFVVEQVGLPAALPAPDIYARRVTLARERLQLL